MKAVVWTDAIQSCIMITGIFAVMIRTTSLVGGFGKVAEALERGQRNTFSRYTRNCRPFPVRKSRYRANIKKNCRVHFTNFCQRSLKKRLYGLRIPVLRHWDLCDLKDTTQSHSAVF